MRIAFIHQGLAALPELEAYTRFFTSRGHETYVITKNQPLPGGIDAE